ncbi:AEC family transporter [Microbacterium sp. zg.Y1090]|uniref:AEC family transporter n=1 Tax=Microbacterium TaxID=33882 RepID=UPI00214AE37A|nr:MULTISPECIES: AEC family transporter [unclassified Microbacterium]MCR2811948.1 AEC family transporter [Microbacterium sp. zg.Y1084]MCR2818613.1 AEC family transporter [Microbacterium sp. zg.Y1090]MDL5486427.1 AEC family transporter [Microbacterium sp. zg-Y1211]WIM29613.1 AEC family transporter [Microbacterium sp. zg-Y1090]
MLDVATGFVVIGVAILVGYIIGRIDLLGPHGRHVLNRLTFFVLSPFLLFVVLSQADVQTLFSALLPVSAIAAVVVIGVQWLLARFVWRRSTAEATISGLSAGQVNSNNMGIPLSLYLLGSAAFPAPVILLQLIVFTPISLAILDAATSGQRSIRRIFKRTATNPIVVGSVLGAVVSLTGLPLPTIVLDPLQLIANACVPVLLIGYGMSLHGQRVLDDPLRRAEVASATMLKLVAMPMIAWAVGAFLFHLSPGDLLVVTVLAALPTAQNIFTYSQHYGVAEAVSRDTILLTTVGCVPVLLVVMAVLG